MSLSDLRRARKLTQVRMAELLGIGQEGISRLEKRSDLLISTLRNYVSRMGGELDLIVRFPDRPAVLLGPDRPQPPTYPRGPRPRRNVLAHSNGPRRSKRARPSSDVGRGGLLRLERHKGATILSARAFAESGLPRACDTVARLTENDDWNCRSGLLT